MYQVPYVLQNRLRKLCGPGDVSVDPRVSMIHAQQSNRLPAAPEELVEADHDLGERRGVLAPCLQDGRCLFQRDGRADGRCSREQLLLKHPDDLTEILRQRVARASNVELLLNKKPRLVADIVLRIPDVNHASREGDLLHGEPGRCLDVRSPRL